MCFSIETMSESKYAQLYQYFLYFTNSEELSQKGCQTRYFLLSQTRPFRGLKSNKTLKAPRLWLFSLLRDDEIRNFLRSRKNLHKILHIYSCFWAQIRDQEFRVFDFVSQFKEGLRDLLRLLLRIYVGIEEISHLEIVFNAKLNLNLYFNKNFQFNYLKIPNIFS